MAQYFKNQIVLITGASAGIGEALAREFAKQGAHLALLARRKDKLDRLRGELESQATQVLTISCDVTQDQDLIQAVDLVRKRFSKIDVVIANAGFGVSGSFEKLKLDDFKRQFDTNVYGVLRTIYATLDDLKKSQGKLAIIGSVSGHIAVPTGSPYGMSKYAVRVLAETLNYDLSQFGISVTHISPGFIQTDIRQIDNEGVFHPEWTDPIPAWLQMSAPQAARKIARAIHCKKRDLILTPLAHFAIFLNRFFPGLVQILVKKSYKLRYKNAE